MHSRYRTPALATVLQTAIVIPLALSGSFVYLATLTVVSRLTANVGTAAAVPILRRRLADRKNAVRLPLGPAIPLAALAVAIALLVSAAISNLLPVLGALAIGAVIGSPHESNVGPHEAHGRMSAGNISCSASTADVTCFSTVRGLIANALPISSYV